ncbi:NAD-dependent epimerase/dehydratase family protein [Actinoalloteichus hymeniacidonis]|uniref:Nucleoside-diphosphate-sugar epimerase n=1 Tax=Actinoalloteichus hymeniacidonis TaxID=340345 RepID=A0AAC9HQ12_9PSEU|nr:NAD-dependent epimerase/dehydratase family protein [Actinoalloteichus hymeniacidonis]AOS63258.1 nucleoside-diphosphate-sugar epimerase [Actinoalloteichus hymeniacidonis]MBB5908703.1 nucleoside-diphosphate-sugar epimerase [Actinoalloteichus hymeniacidonis]
MTAAGIRVVVVGATGNVGTALVRTLAGDSRVASIVGVARRQPSWRPPKTTWRTADITDDDLVEIFRGADVVVHLAWRFQPTHSPDVTWRTNVLGGIRVFEAVAFAGVPALVYASSVAAYSPGPKNRGVDESWPTHGWPGAAYSREKAYLERVLDTVEDSQPDLRVVRIRPGFILQRQAAQQQRRLFAGPLIPSVLLRPGGIPVVPDLPGLRFQVLHAQDVAEAFRLAALSRSAGGFNLAAEPIVDAELLADCLDATVVRLPARPVRAAMSAAWRLRAVAASPDLLDTLLRLPVLDTTRARVELGWSPVHTSRDALGEFFLGLRTGPGPTPPLAAQGLGRLRTIGRR